MPLRTIAQGTVSNSTATPVISNSTNWELNSLLVSLDAATAPIGSFINIALFDGTTLLYQALYGQPGGAGVVTHIDLLNVVGIDYPRASGTLNLSVAFSGGITGNVRYSVGYTDWAV